MNEQKLLKILKGIPVDTVIPGLTKGKEYIYSGVKEYDSHGKAPEHDGNLVIVLNSDKRQRKEIKLFISTLVYFFIDGSRYLGYGRLPPAYLKYRNETMNLTPNAFEFESHYKSVATHIYRLINK